MENGDSESDAEMADNGTDFSDDVDPNVTRESGIGSPVSPVFLGGGTPGESEFPIPDWPDSRLAGNHMIGTRNRETARGRFPIRPGPGIAVPVPGIGVPGAARRGFLGLVQKVGPQESTLQSSF